MQFQQPSCLETYIDSSVCGQLIKASLIVTLGEEQSNSEVCSQLLNYSFALELNKS